MSSKPLSEALKLFQGGDFNIKCGAMLADVLRAVEDTGKPGKLTITLDVKRQGAAVSVLAKATDKTPEQPPDADLYWTTVDGNLTVQNPAQQKLDLKQVDKRTGEILSVSGPVQALQSAPASAYELQTVAKPAQVAS